jgi:hypothetical protein
MKLQDFKAASFTSLSSAIAVIQEKEGYKTVEKQEDRDVILFFHIHRTETNSKGLNAIMDTSETALSSGKARRSKTAKVSMETIEDEYWEHQGRMPTAMRHLLEDESEWEAFDGSAQTIDNEPSESANMFLAEGWPKNDGSPGIDNVPHPLPDEEPIKLQPWRKFRPGSSSVGISILSMKGWIGNLQNKQTDLHVDSCANMTMISKEYYESLTHKPALQQGAHMQLWQLTDKNTLIAGFVCIPIFAITETGQTIETEAEAYVVPNMTIPILLGEDYQLTYKLAVSRSVDEGTHIHFG